MGSVVEYVGVFHVLKDHVKEAWTQFWENFSNSPDQASRDDGLCNEKEINFRTRVKEKLERLRQQSIHVIDSSSSGQEDYSHLTRPKTRKELMQISAAVMGIEFSYAAETAFVSPLLLNIGLRHRHMTLIWCLSPLLGFFLTPLLGSLSDGCRSSLGRRRPFILLLSVGIVLGLILVPNGKTIGRMLGDTYADDEPTVLKTSSEMASHLLLAPNLSDGPKDRPVRIGPNQTESPWMPEILSSNQDFRNQLGTSDNLNSTSAESSAEKRMSLYKRHSSNYYMSTEDDGGLGATNSFYQKDKDLDRIEFFKALSRQDQNRKLNPKEFQELMLKVADEENNENENSSRHSKNATQNPHPQEGKSGAGLRYKARSKRLGTSAKEPDSGSDNSNFDSGNEDAVKSHPWGLVFTVLGTVLLDFDADACQSPSRAYMLDVTIPEDHAKGLSTFTIMAGLGGSIGYFLGALNWENTFLGRLFGGHVRAVFTLVLFIFIACVIVTLRSFREIPVGRLWAAKPSGGLSVGLTSSEPTAATVKPKPKPNPSNLDKAYARLEDDSETISAQSGSGQRSYGAIQETSFNETAQQLNSNQNPENPSSEANEEAPKFREYVKTIVQLPRSLQWLCVTNFFCWMSLVCYSLYFTDFVGEAVYGGDPTAPRGSTLKEKYDEGVRFGCWGMSLYSLSCSLYSLCIESLVNRFGARRVYIYGQLVYSVGMVMMAIARHPAGVIIFSWTAGIMYATLFTMPYLLVARYHAAETFDIDVDDMMDKQPQMRGLGTDVAIVSSMVFLAQITQALTLGAVVTIVGSTTAIVCAAAIFASCGALCATKVLYLDL